MTITTLQLIELLELWLWPFFRIAGLLMMAPVIGTRTVPVRVRLGVAIAITWVIVPVIPKPPVIDPLSFDGLLISFQQVLIGIAMGLTVRVIFVVLEIAGQAIGQLMGLMLASMVDPQNGNQVPIIGQFYMLLATLLFLAMDGHLLMIAALADSFFTLPVGAGGIQTDRFWELIRWSGVMLTTAVMIALPALVSMLVVNLGFGVMTRAAPQLNIFVVGFPVMIIIGIIVIMLSLQGFGPHMIRLFNDAIAMMPVLVQ
ncbi:MAG: flagellar biosynthetic protein FliR [Thiotrichales bacterium]|nr:flagellar biosynthetic protein FliR [Thiotrichales bacterium]